MHDTVTYLSTSISCRSLTNPRDALHRGNVLQTKVDAQCDQLATELSWTVDVFEYSELLAEGCQF